LYKPGEILTGNTRPKTLSYDVILYELCYSNTFQLKSGGDAAYDL